MSLKNIFVNILCVFSVFTTVFISGCSAVQTGQSSSSVQIGNTVISSQTNKGLTLHISSLSESEFSANENPFPLPSFYNDLKITATVSSISTLKDLTWSVEFVNPNSEWASGKTLSDYIEVKPDTEYANIAYVRVYKAFSEQIRIVVASAYNPVISASVVCDYKARLSGGNLSFTHVDGGHSSAGVWNMPMSDFLTENTAITLTEMHTGT